LAFPRKSIEDYVVLESAFDNLTAITISLWVQLDSRSKVKHALFSYATQAEPNEVLLHINSGPLTTVYFGRETSGNV